MAVPTMNGAMAIVKALEKQGVEYVFGYQGASVVHIFDAFMTLNSKIKLILTRHEQGAAHMADGYARASGKPGVVLVTSGPGAGNVVTGLMTAKKDSVPIVVLSGQQIRRLLGSDSFQEADVISITKTLVKYNCQVKCADDLPQAIERAFSLAVCGRPGPVLIDIPSDVTTEKLTGISCEPALPPPPAAQNFVNEHDLGVIADAWQRSKRPVILAGHGVLIAKACTQLRALAEKMDTPVVTTLLGKGALPETHRLSLGMMGTYGAAYANRAVFDCDFLLNVGARFNDRIVGDVSQFCKNAFIAQINSDWHERGNVVNPDIFVQADAKQALLQLEGRVRQLRRSDWSKNIADNRQLYPLHRPEPSQALTMQYFVDRLYKLTKGSACVATDAGQHQIKTAQFYKIKHPDYWLSSGGAGTMGFGLPAAIGAQIARPDVLTMAVVGDGGFQMTLCELATACSNNLHIKIFVLNNSCLGMVRQRQELYCEGRETAIDMADNPDFVKLAESYGAVGINLKKIEDVDEKIIQALSIKSHPVVVNVEVIPKDWICPILLPSATLDNMLLGPPARR